MKNHFIKNRCLAGAWMVAVMVLPASAAHAQSAAAGKIKYANTCAGCHGPAPGFANIPKVHKASANAAAIPHSRRCHVSIATAIITKIRTGQARAPEKASIANKRLLAGWDPR